MARRSALTTNMIYLYLNANDDFLNGAEERFKTEFKTIKRASNALRRKR